MIHRRSWRWGLGQKNPEPNLSSMAYYLFQDYHRSSVCTHTWAIQTSFLEPISPISPASEDWSTGLASSFFVRSGTCWHSQRPSLSRTEPVAWVNFFSNQDSLSLSSEGDMCHNCAVQAVLKCLHFFFLKVQRSGCLTLPHFSKLWGFWWVWFLPFPAKEEIWLEEQLFSASLCKDSGLVRAP